MYYCFIKRNVSKRINLSLSKDVAEAFRQANKIIAELDTEIKLIHKA